MAAAISVAPVSSSRAGKDQIPCVYYTRNLKDSTLRQRIGVSRWSQRMSAVLRSEFLGQLEQRRRLLKRPLGSHDSVRIRRKIGRAWAALPVVSSVPVLGPVLNAFFNPVMLFIIYAAGATRFWGGFGRTTYSNATPTKITLTALWPALFIASAAYRSNFKKAVQ